MQYFFVHREEQFLIQQRKDDFIWKKLYEFPIEIPVEWEQFIVKQKTIAHKLTHKNLTIQMNHVVLDSEQVFTNFANQNGFMIINEEESHLKSFPKPLENYLTDFFTSAELF